LSHDDLLDLVDRTLERPGVLGGGGGGPAGLRGRLFVVGFAHRGGLLRVLGQGVRVDSTGVTAAAPRPRSRPPPPPATRATVAAEPAPRARSRRAPRRVSRTTIGEIPAMRTGEILTTSPDWGASTIWPSPR